MFDNETNISNLIKYSRSTILSEKYKKEAKKRYMELKKMKKDPLRVFYYNKDRPNKSRYLQYLEQSGYNPKIIKYYKKEFLRLTKEL